MRHGLPSAEQELLSDGICSGGRWRSQCRWGPRKPDDPESPSDRPCPAAAACRLQRRAEAEEKRCTALAAELATERRNTADVTEFLTNELKARALAAAAREARLASATKELAATRSSAEARPARAKSTRVLCWGVAVDEASCCKQGSEALAAALPAELARCGCGCSLHLVS